MKIIVVVLIMSFITLKALCFPVFLVSWCLGPLIALLYRYGIVKHSLSTPIAIFISLIQLFLISAIAYIMGEKGHSAALAFFAYVSYYIFSSKDSQK